MMTIGTPLELEKKINLEKERVIHCWAYNTLEKAGIENIISISFDENKTLVIEQRPIADMVNEKYYDNYNPSYSEDRKISSEDAILMCAFNAPGYSFVIDIGNSECIQYKSLEVWSVDGFDIKIAELYVIVNAYINSEHDINSHLYWFISLRSLLYKENNKNVEINLPINKMKYWSKAIYKLGYDYYIKENVEDVKDDTISVFIERNKPI